MSGLDRNFDVARTQEYSLTPFVANEEFWTRNGVGICEVLRAATEDFLNPKDLPMEEYRVRTHIIHNNAMGTLLKDASGRIIGFTYAIQASQSPVEIDRILAEDFAGTGITRDEAVQAQQRTAEVDWTAIHPDNIHKGGWSLMMNHLEHQLRQSGRFDTMTRHVRHANDYPSKIIRRYGDKIIYQDLSHTRQGLYGPQAYFRIRL